MHQQHQGVRRGQFFIDTNNDNYDNVIDYEVMTELDRVRQILRALRKAIRGPWIFPISLWR